MRYFSLEGYDRDMQSSEEFNREIYAAERRPSSVTVARPYL